MPNWLAEHPSTAYAVLGGLALLTLVFWRANRGRRFPLGRQPKREELALQGGGRRPRRIELLAKPGPEKGGWSVSAELLAVVAVALLVVLAGLVWLTDRSIVTDREQIEEALREMSQGVAARDVGRIFAHVSRDVQVQGHNHESFRRRTEQMLGRNEVQEVVVWDVVVSEVSRERKSAKADFKAKVRSVHTTGSEFFLVRSEFVLELGRWRLKGFQVFNPHVNTNEPLRIPL